MQPCHFPTFPVVGHSQRDRYFILPPFTNNFFNHSIFSLISHLWINNYSEAMPRSALFRRKMHGERWRGGRAGAAEHCLGTAGREGGSGGTGMAKPELTAACWVHCCMLPLLHAGLSCMLGTAACRALSCMVGIAACWAQCCMLGTAACWHYCLLGTAACRALSCVVGIAACWALLHAGH